MMSSQPDATRFRLKRTRQAVRPGELQAELWATRQEERSNDPWVVIGVLQLMEPEWKDLAALCRAVGIEVNEL